MLNPGSGATPAIFVVKTAFAGVKLRDIVTTARIFRAPGLRPYRLAVRTPPFHGGGTGSIPVRVAKPSSCGCLLVYWPGGLLFLSTAGSGADARIHPSTAPTSASEALLNLLIAAA
jgi:hypothetical protein